MLVRNVNNATRLKSGVTSSVEALKIEARNLTKSFGPIKAVTSLNLTFKGPGMIGYLGPNGAGKTTTLKLFTNLLFPTSGETFINDISVQKEPLRAVENVSAVIESPDPYPFQTIEQFLTFVSRVRGIPSDETRNRIANLKDALKLEDLKRTTKTLSKGNKQRVMIAATLLPDSEILFLDEPTAGLDPAESREIRVLLKELKKQKLIVMSSHLMYEVNDTCDKVAFLNKGELLLVDDISSVESKLGISKQQGAEALEQAYMRLIGGEPANGK